MKQTQVLRAVLLSGYQRGGTNIAWNLLQSHPEIVSPIHETGQIFRASMTLMLARALDGRFGSDERVRQKMDALKRRNLDHPDNCFKAPDVKYSSEEIDRAILCMKSVNRDIHFTDLLIRAYPDLRLIFLLRDGYALCEGYVRRGGNAGKVGRLYASIGDRFRFFAESGRAVHFIKFEDVLRDPFKVAQDLFRFVGVDPADAPLLRLKAKKVIAASGKHEVAYGEKNRKYWFDAASIGEILAQEVDATQSSRLSSDMIADFNREGAATLRYFGYPVRNL